MKWLGNLFRNVQCPHGNIPLSWILLDSHSTVDVFINQRHLCIICQATHQMYNHTMAGVARTNPSSDVPGYGTISYHPGVIVSILSPSKSEGPLYGGI